MGTKHISLSSSKVVDAAASAAAAFACLVTWDRAPRLGLPRPVVLGTGSVVADAAGLLSPDAGGDCTSDSTAAGFLPAGGGGCTSNTSAGPVDDLACTSDSTAAGFLPAGGGGCTPNASAGPVDDLACTSDSTAAGLLPTGGGGCTSDTAAGAVEDPESVAKVAVVPAGPDDIAGGEEDKSMPAAAISLRACILRKTIASGVSRISAVLKNATVVRSVVARARASRASELSLSVRDARISSLISLLAALESRGRDWKAIAAGDPFSSSSVSLGEARPPADGLEEPAPPAPPSAAAAPAAPLHLSTWCNTRQHDTYGHVVCFAFRSVVLPFASSDVRSFRIASEMLSPKQRATEARIKSSSLGLPVSDSRLTAR